MTQLKTIALALSFATASLAGFGAALACEGEGHGPDSACAGEGCDHAKKSAKKSGKARAKQKDAAKADGDAAKKG